MSTLDRAKSEAERLANEMRSSADKMRQSKRTILKTIVSLFLDVETSFNQSGGKAYSYTTLTQQLRLGQLIALPLQALALYLEADRIGLLGFLIPFSLICANAYLTFMKWQKHVDGRSEAQTLVNSRNTQARTHAGIRKFYAMFWAYHLFLEVFGGFLLALFVHLIAPKQSTSMFGSLVFNLADYLIIAAAFACVALDLFEGLKNKSR